MSLYEVLVVAALVGVGCFAYRLYRKDTSQDSEVQTKQAAAARPMFGRDRSKPDAKG
jgi:Tfp pilus assembly protein PilV